MTPCVAGRLASTMIGRKSRECRAMSGTQDKLTERERECLRLVHAHLNSKQIARELGIKPGTVDRHCENAVRKLQAGNRIDAALRLAAWETVGTDSQSDPIPMAQWPSSASLERANEDYHDRETGSGAGRQLERGGSHSHGNGQYAGQTFDGRASGGGHAQAGALPDARRGDGRALLSGDGLARSGLQSVLHGNELLGRILVVFGVAAAAALILLSLAGAESFAFLLQKFRYGG
ncbi:helix-turn-helix transcriptional regulator [Brevundimonas goettingensis]|uniref:Helix-turn-helix transcriptional regulator n=1 Tax=Brevundimonas goettingensis TaxID=2774190 RepID=A0A975C1Z8_9CAUL|nr:helix-turn-helix transcriptional regulator [Brevundimonas goettingensis]